MSLEQVKSYLCLWRKNISEVLFQTELIFMLWHGKGKNLTQKKYRAPSVRAPSSISKSPWRTNRWGRSNRASTVGVMKAILNGKIVMFIFCNPIFIFILKFIEVIVIYSDSVDFFHLLIIYCFIFCSILYGRCTLIHSDRQRKKTWTIRIEFDFFRATPIDLCLKI